MQATMQTGELIEKLIGGSAIAGVLALSAYALELLRTNRTTTARRSTKKGREA